MLFNQILKEDESIGIEPDSKDAKFVMNLIEGQPDECPDEKRFLFDIVSNSRNSIDVDKFDYILRDCRCINVPSYQSFNLSLLTDHMLPIDGELCFPSNYSMEICKLFKSRWNLHKDCYNH